MDPATARELGEIKARLDGQDRTLATQNTTLAAIDQKLDDVTTFMHEHKGGVRMLVMLGSFAAAVGSAGA